MLPALPFRFGWHDASKLQFPPKWLDAHRNAGGQVAAKWDIFGELIFTARLRSLDALAMPSFDFTAASSYRAWIDDVAVCHFAGIHWVKFLPRL